MSLSISKPCNGIFILGNKASVITSQAEWELTGGAHCTVWDTNGIANSSFDLLCTLITSRLKGSHRPFQILTYSTPNFLVVPRRLEFPLFSRWPSWDLKRQSVLPRSLHWPMWTLTGHSDFSRMFSTLTWNCHRILLAVLSVHLKQCWEHTKAYSKFDLFRVMEVGVGSEQMQPKYEVYSL